MNTKRLGLILICSTAIYFGLRMGMRLFPEDSQSIHLRQVAKHIEAIEPSWQLFKGTNSGFELVKFYPETREDGMLGARGFLTSELQVAQLVAFVTNTLPPRPFYIKQIRVVDAEAFKYWLGPESSSAEASNESRSQP